MPPAYYVPVSVNTVEPAPRAWHEGRAARAHCDRNVRCLPGGNKHPSPTVYEMQGILCPCLKSLLRYARIIMGFTWIQG